MQQTNASDHSKSVAVLDDLKSGNLGGHLESGGGHNPVDSEDNEDDQEERNVDADSNETGQAILMFIYLRVFSMLTLKYCNSAPVT